MSDVVLAATITTVGGIVIALINRPSLFQKRRSKNVDLSKLRSEDLQKFIEVETHKNGVMNFRYVVAFGIIITLTTISYFLQRERISELYSNEYLESKIDRFNLLNQEGVIKVMEEEMEWQRIDSGDDPFLPGVCEYKIEFDNGRQEFHFPDFVTPTHLKLLLGSRELFVDNANKTLMDLGVIDNNTGRNKTQKVKVYSRCFEKP